MKMLRAMLRTLCMNPRQEVGNFKQIINDWVGFGVNIFVMYVVIFWGTNVCE